MAGRTPEEAEAIRSCLALIPYVETEEQKKAREAKEEADEMDGVNERLFSRFGIQRKNGRPSKMDEQTLAKLISALSIGANDEEACTYA